MKLLNLAIFLIFFVLKISATANFDPKIINEERIIAGHPAEEGQFPWHVMLRRTFYGPPFCGGSLISKQWILSAAHCVEGLEEVYLSMGSSMWDSNSAVSKTVLSNFLYIHSAYEPKYLHNDIALVKMPIPIRLTKFIQTISLPIPSTMYEQLIGKEAIAIGFGLTNDSETQHSIPANLMFVEAAIISNEMCSSAFNREIPENSLCFHGASNQSTCSGDSGGSLVTKNDNDEYVLIGVTSFGAKNCKLPWPSVFIRVTSFLEWIQSASLES